MEHEAVRTMFFRRVNINNPHVKIDGNDYTISTNAIHDMDNSKECLVDIYNFLEPERKEEECTFENYNQWKKELTKLLKKWDVAYHKHCKQSKNEM